MENSPFAMHPSILENNLFSGHSGKKGKSQISANFLPHLFHYVKTLLSESERNSLKDYDVQIFIIETALGQKRFTDLNVICDYIIKEIRNDLKYWIKNTEPFMKIYEEVKEQGETDEKIDAAILSMKEENENAFKEYRDYNSKVANIYNDEMENDASLANNENKEIRTGNKKAQSEQYMKPTIEEFIPEAMDFNFKTFESTLETYYTNKNDNPVKKIRTRWQDRRDKQLLNYPQEMVKNYVGVFKEMRDNDPNFARNIFFCDRSQKIPRIEIQLFPTIFQFLMKKYNLSLDVKTTEQVFLFHRVQNLIYLCLLTDDKSHVLCNPNRIYKGAFLENINEMGNNDFEVEEEELNEEEKKEEDEGEQNEKEEIEEEEDDDDDEEEEHELLLEFKAFSQNNNGIIVETLFGTDREMKQRKFNLLLNCLRICKIFIEKIWKWELSVIPSLDAQDATFDNFKIRELIHKLDNSDDFSDDILETVIDYYHLDFEHKNIWKYLENMLQYKSFLLKEAPKTEKEEIQGAFSSKEFCLVSIENYQNYFDDPTIAKKRSYIFHTSHRKKFSSEECRKFLEGLHKFYDTPVNNKKIAKHIGPHIKSNHVRFIKNLYLRRLRKKAKAQNTPIRDLLKSDMETNNIKEVLESL